jgi:[acyl-carrier-protein] S-malonyltransferase
MANPLTLADRLPNAAFAFRGYNTTNLGRTPELLAHPAYGPIVERHLNAAAEVTSDVVGRRVDLVDRVRRREETSLASYDEAIALVVAVELAQLELLEKFFGIAYSRAKLVYGYSLGELSAVVASGLFEMQHALRLPLSVAADAVALAEGVTLGVLFSRGPLLDIDQVQRLCLEISQTGQGVIGVSAILAPNTVLLMGQQATLDRFAAQMHDAFPARVYLRKNKEQWPPMHTPITWQRSIPNRVAVMLQTLPGGFKEPAPPLLSLVTGKLSYNDYNARDLLCRWIDHPQRLWDAVYETLAWGVLTVIHVGPDPNLIVATFQRLRDNVASQMVGRSLNSLGLRAMSQAVKRPWLTALLPSRSALLRAPLVEHIILEDWLLAQKAP